jgi:hypothetical protein
MSADEARNRAEQLNSGPRDERGSYGKKNRSLPNTIPGRPLRLAVVMFLRSQTGLPLWAVGLSLSL